MDNFEKIKQSINEFLINLGLVIKADKVVEWIAERLGYVCQKEYLKLNLAIMILVCTNVKMKREVLQALLEGNVILFEDGEYSAGIILDG